MKLKQCGRWSTHKYAELDPGAPIISCGSLKIEQLASAITQCREKCPFAVHIAHEVRCGRVVKKKRYPRSEKHVLSQRPPSPSLPLNTAAIV